MARGGRRLPGIAALALWWVLFFGLWITLTDNVQPPDLMAGAASALLAAAVLRIVAGMGDVRLAVRPVWVLRAAALPWWVARDSALVLWAIVTRRRGRPRTVPFAAGGDAPLDRGRRSVALGLGSAGPNQYAIAGRSEDDALLIHELVPSRTVTATDLVREP